jgi:hypothetical protein
MSVGICGQTQRRFLSVLEGPAAPQERLQALPLAYSGAAATSLAGAQCLAACPLQAESPEHYLGLFAVAHRQDCKVTLGRVLVSRGGAQRSGAPEASVEVLTSLPVESAPGRAARASALHVSKHQLVFGTAEGVVALRHLHDAHTSQFHLAQGRRSTTLGSGPHCHAVSTAWYASDIVIAAGCVLERAARLLGKGGGGGGSSCSSLLPAAGRPATLTLSLSHTRPLLPARAPPPPWQGPSGALF